MNYSKSIQFLNSLVPNQKSKWNKNWGLEKIRYFLEKLENPHRDMKFVHITGTSGKGSTSTILASILKESGYKTGLHISPHILSERERAQINGLNISEEKFAEIFTSMQDAIKDVDEKFGVKPSYFETLLVIAFIYFKQENCDLAVIEVGLGGKLDGTNIIDSHYQIITNIGLDHTEILGDTKDLILKDKQEIIKNNSIVVSGIDENNLKEILLEKIKATNSQILLLNKDFSYQNVNILKENNISDVSYGSQFDYSFNDINLKNLEIHSPGLFQVTNSCLAITMALKMQNEFPNISENSIRAGLKKIKLLGRFQIISNDPTTIIDGAHNPDKIKTFVESIKQIYPDKNIITVFRYKKRKDIMESFLILENISKKIIITGSKRAGDMGWEEMYDDNDLENLNKITKIETESDPVIALKKAQAYARENENTMVIATGSFFMIDDILHSINA